mgnify:CR=1 FL=1
MAQQLSGTILASESLGVDNLVKKQHSVVQWLQDIYNNCNEYEKYISKSDWEEAKHIEKFIIEKTIDEALNAYGIIKKDNK